MTDSRLLSLVPELRLIIFSKLSIFDIPALYRSSKQCQDDVKFLNRSRTFMKSAAGELMGDLYDRLTALKAEHGQLAGSWHWRGRIRPSNRADGYTVSLPWMTDSERAGLEACARAFWSTGDDCQTALSRIILDPYGETNRRIAMKDLVLAYRECLNQKIRPILADRRTRILALEGVDLPPRSELRSWTTEEFQTYLNFQLSPQKSDQCDASHTS